MDIQSLWNAFRATGSVEDYLRYAQCRREQADNDRKKDRKKDKSERGGRDQK